MSTQDSTTALSASERINRWGAQKPASPEATLSSSIAAARRKVAVIPAPAATSEQLVSSLLQSDSVELPQPLAAEPSLLSGEAVRNGSSSLETEVARLSKKLDTIAASVEFTEAYVSAGITRSIGDILVKEIGAAQSFAAVQSRYRWQHRLWALAVLALVILLAVEVRLDFLEGLVEILMLQGKVVLSYGVAGIQWGAAGISALLS